MEVLEQHHDLEEVRALLGHSRIARRDFQYPCLRVTKLRPGNPLEPGDLKGGFVRRVIEGHRRS